MFTDFSWNEAVTGSPVFIVLLVCSVITVGVALERAYYFWKRRGNPDKTLSNALTGLNNGDMAKASSECESTAHPMGSVAVEVLRGDLDSNSSEERLQIALSQQKILLERNLGILGTMAAVAPLIGLLGTVWGIMRAFHDMARTGSAAPSVVASGVAEALITTAAGLVIAVPAVMLYNHFRGKLSVMLTIAENHTRSLRTAMTQAAQSDGLASARTTAS
jgi:biopolymer transport protein ExbB